MQINKHGSFYIRNGWPTKIVDAITRDPYVFSPNKELEAVDDIGVGRVMIKAMRYWAVTLGLSDESKTQQGVIHTLTPLGQTAARQDPYFQDKGTLWLMHRKLACDKEGATAWYWAFNELGARDFSKESFCEGFSAYLQKNGGKYAKSAVEKEFDCLKNTYVADKAFDIDRILNEETVPFFAPLGLIRYAGGGRFEMRRTGARDVPLAIALCCIIEDNGEHLKENRQIGVDQLLEGSCQIGRYMNLSYAVLLEILQQLENQDRLALVNNFGSRYIQLRETEPEAVLTRYYRDGER